MPRTGALRAPEVPNATGVKIITYIDIHTLRRYPETLNANERGPTGNPRGPMRACNSSINLAMAAIA